MDTLIGKINILEWLIMKWGFKFLPYRLFLTTDSSFYYATHSKDKNYCTLANTNGWTIGSFWFSPDRWKILDILSKFEFLSSQIVFAKLNPEVKNIDYWNRDLMNYWDNILDGLTFDYKIQFIKSFCVNPEQKKTLNDKIYKIKDVRNSLAHSINLKYIEYNSGFLSDKENYNLFQNDIYEAWNTLIEIYVSIWNQEKLVDCIILNIEEKITQCKSISEEMESPKKLKSSITPAKEKKVAASVLSQTPKKKKK